MRASEAACQAGDTLNALSTHVGLLDIHGVIISVNDAWRRFASANGVQGLGNQVGANYLDICDNARGDGSSDAHLAAEGIRAVLSGGAKDFSMEYPCHSPTEQRWFQLVATPLREDRLAGAVVMHANITKRKRIENALCERDQNFQQLTANITDAFWIRSADMREIQYLSPAFERIWGRSVESLLENPDRWTDFIVLEDRERVLNVFATLMREARSVETEYRIVRPDGDIRWVRLRGFQVRSASDELIRLSGIVSDITEAHLAAEELRAGLEQFRTLAEAMPQMVWITRPDGMNVYFNQQWMDYTGLTFEESLGHGWNKPFHPEDRQPAWDAWQHATRTTGVYRLECRLRRADGVYRWWLIRGVPLQDSNGLISKWFGTCTDIHDLKMAEQVLREASAAAEASTRLKSQFLANMSHEIRTPMNGVIGMIDLLMDTDLNGDQRVLADTVRSSAEALLAVMNDILDFSKIEAGQLTFEEQPFDLSEPIKDCLAIMAERAHTKGLEVRYFVDANVPTRFDGDAGRIRQILLNLVGNAIKFTAKGEVVVSVTKLSERDGRVRLRMAVRDTGLGLSTEQQARLFQPFVQADTSTTRRFGGTGLGLAICKQLVGLMHGEIGIDSEPDEGSTFWFTIELPIAKVEARFIPSRAGEVSASFDAPKAAVKLRILVAEDNLVNQHVARRHLTKLGYQPEIVADGAKAVEAVRSRRYDVIFMDCQMPELDGFQATRSIREWEAAQRERGETVVPLHVVALTANAMVGDREACLAAGMSDYMSKPIRASDLAAALARSPAARAQQLSFLP